LVLEIWLRHSAPVTHQDQGVRDVLRRPLAAFAAPENPLFPIASNSHDRMAVAQRLPFIYDPNPRWLAMRTLQWPQGQA